ncbi:MAG TPA: SPOR domain-containing protein, partial [Pseudohongiella sp.]|nr:SPOR domain-containing protein [Pseudohongiella sp.]
NDRGPFHNDRILDLSYAAAWKLGFADKGTALVHIEAVVPGRENVILAANTASSATSAAVAVPAVAAGTGGRYLQAGAFSDLAAAQRLSDRLRGLTGSQVVIRTAQAENNGQPLHRVRVGPILDNSEIERITNLIRSANLGQPYVVVE